jgi:membrane protease YdiL (CAAX protease family)
LTGCIGEEIGWRGYLLPLLSKKHGLFVASVATGAMWGFWHFQFSEGLGFLLFIVSLMELAVIMTWLFHKGNGNLAGAVAFHAFLNFSGMYFYDYKSIMLQIVQILVLLAPVILISFKSSIFLKKT